MKKIIPKINFNKKDCKRILSRIIYCKRLLFIIFFGTLLIFTFDIVYRYAFLNVEYVDYVEDDNFIITDGKINNINLNRVLKNIDKDREKIKIESSKEYEDPFSFRNSELLNESDYEIKYDNENEDENINNGDLDGSKDLNNDENNESNGVIFSEL